MDSFERMQNSKFYRFFDWVSRLIVVNLVMVALACCGLLIFGIFPATFAAAAYFNDVLNGDEAHMWKRMFGYFKKYFWVGNLLMLLAVPTVGLGFYVIYGKEWSTFAYLILFTWIILIMVLCWYLPSITVLYPDFSLKKKFLFSLVVACDRWLLTIIFLCCNLGWLYIVLLIPQFMFFIAFSTPVCFAVWSISKALKIERKPLIEDDEWITIQEQN